MQKLGFQSAISAIDKIRDFDSTKLKPISQNIGEGIIVQDVRYFFEYYSKRLVSFDLYNPYYTDFVTHLLLNVIEKNGDSN